MRDTSNSNSSNSSTFLSSCICYLPKLPFPGPFFLIAVGVVAIGMLPTTHAQTIPPPQLDGQHFRITALQEHGFLDIYDDDVDGSIRYSGYLIDMLEALARPERGNFTYTLLPPSGYGSLCVPRLNASNVSDEQQPQQDPLAYDAQFRTQYNCGASDVNDQPLQATTTDMYLGMYYVTPSRQVQNQFTLPFVPPFSGTLAMFGTATGIASFDALQELQALGVQPAACAPAGTALIDFLPAAYPGLNVKGLFGGEDEVLQAFRDGTCSVYITDGPIAAQFVLRRSRRDECIANGKPIGVIGEPMGFGLSHYAIGVRRDVDPAVVDTLSYWINVLMSCNPLDPEGGCTDGNLATFYEGRGGDGTECDYVLFPTSEEILNPWAIVGIVVSSVGFVVLVCSIWHRHRLNRQRRQFHRKQKATLALAKRERELNEFIAHEIRNPLSSAIAALNFVSAQTADPEHVPLAESRAALKDDLNILDGSLQFVNDLLRNMLDVHRSHDKAMSLNWGPTDILRDVLEPVVSIIRMRGANVQVQAICEPNTLVVQADRMRLKQICLNLAVNASKFVEKGYIKLRAEVVAGTTDSTENVMIYVEDSGPGIPAQKRRQLFVRFQESLDVLSQGTGIGLSVCKSLSELMQAELYLDENFQSDVPGCAGTRFVLRLNQVPMDLESAGEEVSHKIEKVTAMSAELTSNDENHDRIASQTTCETEEFPQKISVLFVDDDTILRNMFCRTIRTVVPREWDVVQACDGETALRLIDDGGQFDLIFMDHYMASHNKSLLGTETIQAIRSRGVRSIICGLSANDKEEEFRQAGADAFMLKPFPCRKDALQRALLRVMRSRSGQSLSRLSEHEVSTFATNP
mmetsp:Transcript_23537/g.44765  ORF Transcript_23537/g.44765 Transcript_23537/m.44765 type:complete len:858 (-) Transcript_23537:181-2754(-)